jgi:hypothetical protein
MKLEIATFEAIDAWSVIDRFDHHVIASTWAFKCKRYPDGRIKKLKAHVCAIGDKQLEGTDFFDTYANDPQDIESLGGEGGLFGRVPGGPQVGAANRSQGRAHDGPGQDQGRPLGDQGLPLERQGQAQACGGLGQAQGGQVPRSARQAPGLLGMLGCKPSQVSLAVSAASASVIPISGYFGMIKRIIKALGLDNGAKGKFIPSESKPLVKDINGDLASGAFSYSSVVGMLLYLSGRTCPGITFAVIVVLVICSALNIHMS